jgi:hypothetical protein
MTLLAPPKPPSPEDLEALIEEARRRARRRRLAYLAATVLAVAAGAGIYSIVAFTGGGGERSALPDGFSYVQARGPVQHLREELDSRPPRTWSIALATEDDHPIAETDEVWFDPATKLYRVVGTWDGRRQFDLVGREACFGPPGGQGREFCIPPGPFSDLEQAPRWPLDPKRGRVTGTGTFRGHDVIWVEALANGHPIPGGCCERWGVDAHTHSVLARRQYGRVDAPGRPRYWQQNVYTKLTDLPAKSVAFAVPEGGLQRQHDFPPNPGLAVEKHSSSLRAAGDTLGKAPFWLGPRFRGHRLLRIEVGTEGMEAKAGKVLVPASFVSFDYGIVKLQEFGSKRSFRYGQGPPSGRIFLFGSQLEVNRDGILVVMTVGDPASFRVDRPSALSVARALLPVPGG